MVQLSNAQVAEVARELGHVDLTLEPTMSGRRWVVTCSCGYGAPMPDGRPSRTYATQAVALDMLRNHLRKSVENEIRKARGNGRVSIVESRLTG